MRGSRRSRRSAGSTTTSGGTQEPAGPLAAHHAGRVPQGQARLGGRPRPGRPRQGGEGELGLARGPGAAARVQGRPGLALARRRRRGDRPRVRPRDEVVRQGRLHPARGQEPGRLARNDSVFVGTDFGPGSLTKSGYPRIVKEWKRGTPLAEAAWSSRARPRTWAWRAFRDLTPGFERDFVVRTPTS